MDDIDDAGAGERAAEARKASPFLSPAQAAHYLGITVRTLQKYRSKRTGPAFFRHGNNVRYHIDDLIAWSQRMRRAGDDV